MAISQINQILVLSLEAGHLGADLRYRAAIKVMITENKVNGTTERVRNRD